VDRRTRAIWRGLAADGTLVTVITDIIKGLDPDSQDAKEISKWLRFYNDRIAYKWRLGNQRFSIAHLGDDSIDRLINERSCQNWQRYWIRNGQEKKSDGDWSYGDWTYNRRSVYTVLLEEAEYRGITTAVQKAWIKVLNASGRGAAALIDLEKSCNERGGHSITFVDENYICINCREKVSREEVVSIAKCNLRGRLREFAGEVRF